MTRVTMMMMMMMMTMMMNIDLTIVIKEHVATNDHVVDDN